MKSIKFGPVRDVMTQLKSGIWVMHSFRPVIVDNIVVGSAEFHLSFKNEAFGVITVTRNRQLVTEEHIQPRV